MTKRREFGPKRVTDVRSHQRIVAMVVGAVMLRVGSSGDHTDYVRPTMGRWIVLAGFALVALAIGDALRPSHQSHDATDDADTPPHTSTHTHGAARVGWLLLVPVVAQLVVAPGSLGQFGADRVGSATFVRGRPSFDDLDPSAAPVRMSAVEFVERSSDAEGRSFNATPVRVRGFVLPGSDRGESFTIAQYTIACCAADALVAKVRVTGVNAPPVDAGDSRWIEVEGTFAGPARDANPATIAATALRLIEQPKNPYG